MSECWKILGIEPTNDKRKIRSAYAAGSRECHLEENPEEFARLNQAYQEALEYALESHRGKEEGALPDLGIETKALQDTAPVPDTPAESDAAPAPSLLQRLQMEEEIRIEESMAEGALQEFTAIFQAARESGKVPRAALWKDFFLSGVFLREQYEEGFARGMMKYLSEWSMEGNYNIHALPSNFLLELAIAYALVPETGSFSSGQTPFGVNDRGSFYGRECAASLWNMQSECGHLPVRLLKKPENLVRLRSFSDYIRLRSLNSNHLLTKKNQDHWERILMCGCVNHLYEQNGKGSRNIYQETRSVCLIRLMTFWVREEEVPACVLEYMYKEYNLKNVEHSSSKYIYHPLRQEILKKYPDIEQVLYGAASRTRMERDWYRDLTKIVSDNHSDYDKGIYEETEETEERIRELFARPEWQEIKYSEELLARLFGQFYKRMVVPASMAERLIGFFTEGQKEGRWADAQKVSALVETLIQSLAFNRRIRDIDDLRPLGFGRTGIEDIGDDNRDFWYYYLMVGFGFRRAELKSGTEAASSLYTRGSACYLPLYMKYTYYPARQWIRKFVGYSRSHGSAGQGAPAAAIFYLPDGRSLRVEFHLHYCLYFLDGKPVCRPAYSFQDFVRMAAGIERTQEFFFLLAITGIGDDERAAAQELAEEWLARLVLYPSTVPLIARMLVEETEEPVQISHYEGVSSYCEKAVPASVSRLPDRETDIEEGETEMVQAVYYTEQEDYCFRVLVTDRSIRLYHQREFGWYELPMPEENGLLQAGQGGTNKQVQEVLKQLQRPRPVSLNRISVEGLGNEEKAAKILEALRQYEEYRRRDREWDAGSGAGGFFEKEGSFLTESYCILRFGPEKKKERMLYCGIDPYAFQAEDHNWDFEASYQFRRKELSRKIKEKHQILGNFGWGEAVEPKESFEPSPFAIGESGTYYNFDVFRMHRSDNLASLLSKMFDLSKVTEVETYRGCLSFSRLGKRLEYCFGEEDMRRSMYSPGITTVDVFVRFTRAGWMTEFARWANGILACPQSLCRPLFVMEQGRGNIFSLSLYERGISHGGDTSCQGGELIGDSLPLIWKRWEMNVSVFSLMEELRDTVIWYMEHGRHGGRLKSCLNVDAVCHLRRDEADGAPVEWEIYSNENEILEN